MTPEKFIKALKKEVLTGKLIKEIWKREFIYETMIGGGYASLIFHEMPMPLLERIIAFSVANKCPFHIEGSSSTDKLKIWWQVWLTEQEDDG